VAGTRRFLDRAWRLVRGEAATVVPGHVDDKKVDKAHKKVVDAVQKRFGASLR